MKLILSFINTQSKLVLTGKTALFSPSPEIYFRSNLLGSAITTLSMERARPFLDWYGVLFYDSRYVTHNPLTPKSD